MRVLLTAHGSRGDVFPMIALGQKFLCGKHQVTILTQPTHSRKVEDAGLQGLYTSENMMESMASMGSGWKGIRRMMDWSRRSLDEEFTLLEKASAEADLVISTNQEFSVSSIAEWRGIPAFRLSYIPAIPGDHTPPLIPWQNLPVPINRMIWKAFGIGLDSMSKKTVNRWRTARNLPAVESLTPHMTSVFLTLYGFNSTLAPPHRSWNPRDYRYCGYCFEDDEDESLPSELETFLNRGPAPVYLGFGSVTVPETDRLTRTALEAAQRSSCRLIIGKGWTGLGTPEVLGEYPDLSDRVLVIDEVSHTRLFPRCAGICHHGGAGTTHRAARAGVPQFIMPLIVDQHFWGNRIHDFGAGPAPRSPGKIQAAALAEVFTAFTGNTGYRDAARNLQEAVLKDRGTEGAYRIVTEQMRTLRPGAA